MFTAVAEVCTPYVIRRMTTDSPRISPTCCQGAPLTPLASAAVMIAHAAHPPLPAVAVRRGDGGVLRREGQRREQAGPSLL